jgi:hypothetical protein
MLGYNIAILLLNVGDTALTLYLIGTGAAEEYNPVMGFFLEHGCLSFLLMKLFLVGWPLLLWSHTYKKYPITTVWAQKATLFGFLSIYTYNFLWQLPYLIGDQEWR